MLEAEGDAGGLGDVPGLGQLVHNGGQAGHVLGGRILDGQARGQMLQRAANLQNGADLPFGHGAAAELHDGDESVHVAVAPVIGHKGALAGPHLQKAVRRQLREAPVHHRAADLHLAGQLPLDGELGADGQLAGEDGVTQLPDEQVLQGGGGYFFKLHRGSLLHHWMWQYQIPHFHFTMQNVYLQGLSLGISTEKQRAN